MRRFLPVLFALAAPGLALAQASQAPSDPSGYAPIEEAPQPAPAPPPQAEALPQPAPAEALPQPSPAAQAQPVGAPAGQWVYTNQYGWLWIPYAREYTYVGADLQVYPDQYVYYPAYGWRWVVAPWVFGYGPAPVWGVYGPRYYVWYSRPWFRVGGYWGWGGYRGWGQYRGWVGPRAWGPRGWAQAPAYYRSGVGSPHPAPALHAAPPRRAAERERIRRERHGHQR